MSAPALSHPPEDLIELQLLFDAWRHSRVKRSSIPEHLVSAARSLLDRYSMAAICRACRLHPRSLKQRLTLSAPQTVADAGAAPQSTHPSPKDHSPLHFFQLPPAPQKTPDSAALLSQTAPGVRLQFERPDGCRLILDMPLSERSQLASLCTAFLRH